MFTILYYYLSFCVYFYSVHPGIQNYKVNAQIEDTNPIENNVKSTSAGIKDLIFTPKDAGVSYKVGALNKQLTNVIIPATYNGLPVTEIADNGFNNCRNLERVFVPATVTRIGNNAFMNSSKLKRVVGMVNVESYGNNAFSMCTNLENLILSKNIKTLGTSMIRNVNHPVYARSSEQEMELLNPNWNYNGNIIHGNSIVYDKEYVAPDGTQGYAIESWQNLPESIEPLILYSWCYEDENDNIGKPLLNIKEGAFSYFTVPSITIQHPEGSGLNHSINLEASAFSYTVTDSIKIEVDITLEDSINEEGRWTFYGSTMQSVTLPDSLTRITEGMFGECMVLTEIKNTNPNIATNQLSNKIISIGENAFYYCFNIPELYIQNTIEYIGALPPTNTTANISSFIIPRGTKVLTGTVAAQPLWGHIGGGIQWWLTLWSIL